MKNTTTIVWTAPAAVFALRQNGGSSSWHVQPIGLEVDADARVIHGHLYGAGHFRLTAFGDVLESLRRGGAFTGRTPGRALRRLRRYLRRHPVAFE